MTSGIQHETLQGERWMQSIPTRTRESELLEKTTYFSTYLSDVGPTSKNSAVDSSPPIIDTAVNQVPVSDTSLHGTGSLESLSIF
jgi:hypothetical protein